MCGRYEPLCTLAAHTPSQEHIPWFTLGLELVRTWVLSIKLEVFSLIACLGAQRARVSQQGS